MKETTVADLKTWKYWQRQIANNFPLNEVPPEIVSALKAYAQKEKEAVDAENALRDAIDRTCRAQQLWSAREAIFGRKEADDE